MTFSKSWITLRLVASSTATLIETSKGIPPAQQGVRTASDRPSRCSGAQALGTSLQGGLHGRRRPLAANLSASSRGLNSVLSPISRTY